MAWPGRVVRVDAATRAASKSSCSAIVEALGRFHVTTYVNDAKPESEAAMLSVFPKGTMTRLQALKNKYDPDNAFKMGAWQYEANR